MYAVIDNQEGSVHGVYSNFSVNLISGLDPSTTMYQGGINCEHSWPQSMGASLEPMKSDLHHLFPCKDNINSSRSNNPYGEITDILTDYWFYLDNSLDHIPLDEVNEYSESYISSNEDRFEPREDRKGDIARTIFYFYTMYSDVANDNFFEGQKEVLQLWHEQDPADENEISRTWQIASYQEDKPNPFILDATLIERAYFYDGFIQGDINGDGVLNVLDLVELANLILLENMNVIADMNNDGSINVLDVVILVNIILSQN